MLFIHLKPRKREGGGTAGNLDEDGASAMKCSAAQRGAVQGAARGWAMRSGGEMVKL